MTHDQVFDEEQVRFEFDPALWFAMKWDGSRAFTGPTGIRSLNGELTDLKNNTRVPHGTKAVDFIGLHDGELYLFEVKDFRGYAAENAYRQEVELPLEIGLKVRDTLAGILAAHRLAPMAWTEAAMAALTVRSNRLHVVAWISEDRPKHAGDRRYHTKTTNVRTHQLQERLAWLTRYVWADDPINPCSPLPGVQARTLRSAPNPAR